jgi:hypothetical protein
VAVQNEAVNDLSGFAAEMSLPEEKVVSEPVIALDDSEFGKY